ncbi:MAG: peptide-methionine (S)-S-oxide reductase MsrA [Kiloniellales bacterium]|nr:peptide-methionine (S)-S-oxide reductase MsrA [Kiloniellales bacterium]
MEKATFAAGCFWGVELAFGRLKGVKQTSVGYTGGTSSAATYQEVCSGTTGHAEAVQILFDPTEISYADLVAHFWQIHDPTTLNRQGADIGTQYRSAIYFHSNEQERIARESKAGLVASGKLARPAVTEIEPAGPYHLAEDYHQKYFEKRGMAGLCHSR